MVFVTIPQLNAGSILALLPTGKMGNKSLPENRRVRIGEGVGGRVGRKEAGNRSKPTAFLTLHMHSRLPTPISWFPFFSPFLPPVSLPTPSFPHKSDSFALIFELRRIYNNYSPKWRWLVLEFTEAAKWRRKYPLLATDSEVNNCFSIH